MVDILALYLNIFVHLYFKIKVFEKSELCHLVLYYIFVALHNFVI